MVRRFFVSALLFVSVAALLDRPVAAQSPNKDETNVRALVGRYDAAWNRKDVTGVSNVLAGAYIYFSSTGGVSDRSSTLKFLASPDYKLTSAERSEIVTYRHGATVIVSSRWKGRGSWSGGEINDDQRCGMVFVKVKNRWRLLSEHCVQIKPD